MKSITDKILFQENITLFCQEKDSTKKEFMPLFKVKSNLICLVKKESSCFKFWTKAVLVEEDTKMKSKESREKLIMRLNNNKADKKKTKRKYNKSTNCKSKSMITLSSSPSIMLWLSESKLSIF